MADPAVSTAVAEPKPTVSLDKSGQPPAEGVASWESDLAGIGSSDAPVAAPKAAAPAPQEAPKAAAPTPKQEAKPATPAPGKPAPDAGGRKAKLDPEQLLSFDGDGDVQLPKDVVDVLSKLDARDLRLQSAKLAQALRANGKKVKDLETQLSASRNPQPDPEKEGLTSRLTEIQRRNEDLERRLKQVAYTESPEYKEKYQAPFVEALDEAYSFVKEFSVAQEDGTERTATERDFDRLLAMPHGEAMKQAKAMFGDAASEILARRSKLGEMQRAARKAVDKYKADGEQVEKQRMAEQAQSIESRRKIWEEANREIPKKYAKHFAEIPGDEEGNALLRQGFEIADKVNDQTIPERDRIFLAAVLRHRAAAFGRAANVAARLAKENAELKQIISDYENSAPETKAKESGAGPAATDELDWGKAIDAMARPA